MTAEQKETAERSVTRFGEFSPKYQHFKCLWLLLESLLNIWLNVEPSLEIFLYYWAHFHCYKWANMKKLI